MSRSNKELFEILNKASEEQFEALRGAIDAIATKASILLGGIGVVVTIGATLYAAEAFVINYLIITGFLAFLLSVLLCVRVLWAKSFQLPPNLKKFYQHYKTKSIGSAREKFLAVRYHSLRKNRALTVDNGRDYNIALAASLVGFALITIGLLLPTSERGWKEMDDEKVKKEEVQEATEASQQSDKPPTDEETTPSSSQSEDDPFSTDEDDSKYDFDIIKGDDGDQG